MKPALLAAAAAAAFFAAVLVWREIVRVASSAPPVPARSDDVFTDGFPSALLIPAIPIAVFVMLALGLIVPSSQSFEEATVGLLLTAATMAAVLQTLCGELLIWAHKARRLDAPAEAAVLDRLRRAGAVVNEIWVSSSPIVIFWRFSLLNPAAIVRTRALVWREALDRLPPRGSGGLVLTAPVARYWPWSLLPLGAAIALRARDPYSLLPWWMFAATGGLAAIGAVPDLFAWSRLRRSLRTDSGVADEISGALAFGALEAELALSRALRREGEDEPWSPDQGGLIARWSAAAAWRRAVRRSMRAAKLAGIDTASVAADARRVLDERRTPAGASPM